MMPYSIYVNDIYGAIQGEGVMTGVPMVMLRLQGCKVGCPFCDTKETWHLVPDNQVDNLIDALGATPKYVSLTQGQIAAHITENYSNYRWILLSGGEPAEQRLAPLVYALHQARYKVALETSGTAMGFIEADIDWVVVSPKLNMPGERDVQPLVLHAADEIKMVIGKQSDIDKLDEMIEEHGLDQKAICLQPISQSKKATDLCVKTVQERGTWRLSIQIHKYLSNP